MTLTSSWWSLDRNADIFVRHSPFLKLSAAYRQQIGRALAYGLKQTARGGRSACSLDVIFQRMEFTSALKRCSDLADAVSAGDYETAILTARDLTLTARQELFEALVLRGSKEAMVALADQLSERNFKGPNLVRATELYEKAAAAGSGAALFRLALLLDDRHDADPSPAVRHLTRSAEAGFSPAMRTLSAWFALGHNVPRDSAAATKWLDAEHAALKRHASAGSYDAAVILASRYDEGPAVETRSMGERSLVTFEKSPTPQCMRLHARAFAQVPPSTIQIVPLAFYKVTNTHVEKPSYGRTDRNGLADVCLDVVIKGPGLDDEDEADWSLVPERAKEWEKFERPANAYVGEVRGVNPPPALVGATSVARGFARLGHDDLKASAAFAIRHWGWPDAKKIAAQLEAAVGEALGACRGTSEPQARADCLKGVRKRFADIGGLPPEVAAEQASALQTAFEAAMTGGRPYDATRALEDLNALVSRDSTLAPKLRTVAGMFPKLAEQIRRDLTKSDGRQCRGDLALLDAIAPQLTGEESAPLVATLRGKLEAAIRKIDAREERESERAAAAERRRNGPLWQVKLVCGGVAVPFQTTTRALSKAAAVDQVCTSECRSSVMDFNVCRRKCLFGSAASRDRCEWSVYPAD